MRTIFLNTILLLAALTSLEANADSRQNPIVIELFTSQSCSSCPPADKTLGKLAQNPNIIALSCHVTYWDHLHWKDTLSQEFCTTRQRNYAGTQGRVYTPQMIINGKYAFVGSKKNQAAKAIKKATQESTIQPIKITKGEDTITITLPTLENQPYSLTAFKTLKSHRQKIQSGENRGAEIKYTHPVTQMKNLGSWSGEEKTLTFTHNQTETKNTSLTILAQTQSGEIKAAGKIALHP